MTTEANQYKSFLFKFLNNFSKQFNDYFYYEFNLKMFLNRNRIICSNTINLLFFNWTSYNKPRFRPSTDEIQHDIEQTKLVVLVTSSEFM